MTGSNPLPKAAEEANPVSHRGFAGVIFAQLLSIYVLHYRDRRGGFVAPWRQLTTNRS